jgi:hypothetical protein
MRHQISAYIAISALALASCSLYEVSYTVDQQTDFSRYKTFSFYSDDITDSMVGVFGVDAATIDSAIKSSIQKHMQGKGFTPSPLDSADIWVNYQSMAESTIADRYNYSLEDLNQSYRQKQIRYSSSFDASRRFTSLYDKGTVIVDVIDRKGSQVVWRGIVETPLARYDTEKQRIAALQRAIGKLLTKFPPK